MVERVMLKLEALLRLVRSGEWSDDKHQLKLIRHLAEQRLKEEFPSMRGRTPGTKNKTDAYPKFNKPLHEAAREIVDWMDINLAKGKFSGAACYDYVNAVLERKKPEMEAFAQQYPGVARPKKDWSTSLTALVDGPRSRIKV